MLSSIASCYQVLRHGFLVVGSQFVRSGGFKIHCFNYVCQFSRCDWGALVVVESCQVAVIVGYSSVDSVVHRVLFVEWSLSQNCYCQGPRL